MAGAMSLGANPRQNTCHCGNRAIPSQFFVYQGVMAFSERDRQIEHREVANDQRPDLTAQPFALRRALDGELRQIRRHRRGFDDGRAAIGLLDVRARDGSIEEVVADGAPEGVAEQRAQPVAVGVSPAVVHGDPRAFADHRPGTVDGEQLAQQLQRVHDGDAHLVAPLFQQPLHLAQQHRLTARKRSRRQQAVDVGGQAHHRRRLLVARHQAGPPAQEHHLARLQSLRQLAQRPEARVHLLAGRLFQRDQRDGAARDGGLNRLDRLRGHVGVGVHDGAVDLVLGQPVGDALGLRVGVLGLEQAQHHHRDQAQVGQDAQVEVDRVQRALHDLRAGHQHREALFPLRAEQLQVQIDVGLGADALEKSLDDFGFHASETVAIARWC